MCGICGFAGFEQPGLIEKMAGLLRHRGPDSDGFFCSGEISLGMRRLKVIDLSTGDQPVYNEDRSICVVFNGEIYNFRELRVELEKSGHRFRTASDTEVLVHLYEKYGKSCAQKLEGMFAFALWDSGKRQLLAARDQLGIKPFYYCVNGSRLAFASELKALMPVPLLGRKINPDAIAAYLRLLYIPSPMTAFRDAAKLEPGHLLLWRDGKTSVEKYWSMPDPAPAGRSFGENREMFLSTLKDSVRRHMISDVPLGAFLSGGLDSSAIVAAMSELGGRAKTFSIGYDREEDSSYNELDTASRTAEAFRADHTGIIVNPDAAELLPTIASQLDEPHADSSAIVTYLISKHARSKATVALAGIGGDELFLGYPRYMGTRWYYRLKGLPGPLLGAASACAGMLGESGTGRDLSNWAKRFTSGLEKGEPDFYLGWTTFLRGGEETELLSPSFRELAKADPLSRNREFFASLPGGDAIQRLATLDTLTYLPDDLLMMADKMSMASSLELRVPFCDLKMLEFSLSLSSREKMPGGEMKGFMRRALKGFVPDEVLGRRKQGFMVPLPRWLRHELRPMTLELLSGERTKRRGIFSPAAVDRLLERHYSGRENRADLIWAILCLETWMEAYGASV